MAWNPTPDSNEKATMRAGGYANDQYLLICPNTVIFKAQVAAQTFGSSFGTVTFTNVTVGAYTDIKEGFTVAISDEENFEDVPPENIFRIRANDSGVVSTSTSININQTSVALTPNQYILVVKDVREVSKQPWIDGSTYKKDYEITFRRLLPIVYGLESAYVGILASGQVDFDFPAVGLPTDADATSSITYLWDFDGGSAVSPDTTSTQQPTVRYTSAGHYMPRLTITDSNTNTNWFTFHVFVIPADYSSTVNLSFDGANITNNVTNGPACTVNAPIRSNTDALMQINSMADYTFCAVWWPGNKTTLTSDIAFVGRFRAESVEHNADVVHGQILSTSFELDGLATIMQRLISRRMGFKESTSPTRFDQIETLTPYRAIAYFLTEHTTICNTHSLDFDVFDGTYQYPAIGAGDDNVLQTVQYIAEQINAEIAWSPTGEFRIARTAWYLSATERDALQTAMDMLLQDCSLPSPGGRMFSLSKNYVQNIGRMSSYGSYLRDDGSTQVLKAITPAVTQGDGIEDRALNRQILTAGISLAVAYVELGERVSRDMKARQPRITLTTVHSAAYRWMIPSRSVWWTWTIPATANNRGRAYTSSDRWTLEETALRFDPATSRIFTEAQWVLETDGANFQIAASTPPSPPVTSDGLNNPVLTQVPGYDNLPPDPTLNFPDPDDITEDDLPPLDPIDVGVTQNGSDPATTYQGMIGVLWNADTVLKVTNVATVPGYQDFTPQNLGDYEISDVKPDPFSNALWVLGYDPNTNKSAVFRTRSFGDLQYAKTEMDGQYMLMRTTSVANELYVYSPNNNASWEHTFQFDTASGADPDTTYGNGSFVQVTTGGLPGATYTAGVGWEDKTSGTVRGSYISRTGLTAFSVYEIELFFIANNATEANHPRARIDIANGGGNLDFTQQNVSNSASEQSIIWTGSESGATAIGLAVGVNLTVNPAVGTSTITKAVIRGTGVNPFAMTSDGQAGTRRSTDAGETFATFVEVGDPPSGDGAVDTLLAGTEILASDDTDVKEATSGGSYSSESDGTPTAGEVNVIHAYGDNTTNYIFGQTTLSSNVALYDVNNASRTDITPDDTSNHGIPVGPNSVHMPAGDNDKLFVIATFSGTRKLAYSSNRGTSYAFNTNITNDTFYVRARSGTIIAVVEDQKWYYSGNGGATLYERTPPISTLLGFEFL